MTVYGFFGTMAETALNIRGIFQNFRLSYERQIQTIGKTDDKTNPPRGSDSGRFFRMQIVTVGWMVGRLWLSYLK